MSEPHLHDPREDQPPHQECADEIAEQLAEIARLESENAALREDKVRLEWVMVHYPITRAAIDAAREGESDGKD